MLRPSLNTSRSGELELAKPRELTAHSLAVTCATWIPGASRIASGMLIAPELTICPPVTTATAAAERDSGCGPRVTEVTVTSASCSMLRCLSSLTCEASSCCACSVGEAVISAPKTSMARTPRHAPAAGPCPRIEAESVIGSPLRSSASQASPVRSAQTILSQAVPLVGNSVTCVSVLHQVERGSIPRHAGPIDGPRERQSVRLRQALEVTAIGRNIAAIGEVENHQVAIRAQYPGDLREMSFRELAFRQKKVWQRVDEHGEIDAAVGDAGQIVTAPQEQAHVGEASAARTGLRDHAR